MRRVLILAFALALAASPAVAQDLPRGTVIEDVKCKGDPTQSYALYIPSNYSPDRKWSLLIGFHPGARGRAIVEKYREAAERYGYVVAGSNTSRNGPWSIALTAVKAMVPDLDTRLALDPQRVYLTGHSGGARVAMLVALGNKSIAGVIASSGGFPDTRPRKSVSFAVFGTAGVEDFNYIEMRLLDRALTTPHRLGIFEGGHTLPPDDVAMAAIEWMEIQAMKAGRKPHDAAFLDRMLARRKAEIDASSGGADTVHLLDAAVADFTGLRDVSAEATRLKDLSKRPEVKRALDDERKRDDREERAIGEFVALEAALADDQQRPSALMQLRQRLTKLAEIANRPDESPERTQARRQLRAITAGASARVQDREYLALLQQLAPRRQQRSPLESQP